MPYSEYVGTSRIIICEENLVCKIVHNICDTNNKTATIRTSLTLSFHLNRYSVVESENKTAGGRLIIYYMIDTSCYTSSQNIRANIQILLNFFKTSSQSINMSNDNNTNWAQLSVWGPVREGTVTHTWGLPREGVEEPALDTDGIGLLMEFLGDQDKEVPAWSLFAPNQWIRHADVVAVGSQIYRELKRGEEASEEDRAGCPPSHVKFGDLRREMHLLPGRYPQGDGICHELVTIKSTLTHANGNVELFVILHQQDVANGEHSDAAEEEEEEEEEEETPAYTLPFHYTLTSHGPPPAP
jgi:hypothetical protein